MKKRAGTDVDGAKKCEACAAAAAEHKANPSSTAEVTNNGTSKRKAAIERTVRRDEHSPSVQPALLIVVCGDVTR